MRGYKNEEDFFANCSEEEFDAYISEEGIEDLRNNPASLKAMRKQIATIYLKIMKPGHMHYGKHRPTGEDWCIIGFTSKKVCVAGYPATIGELSDMDMNEFNVRPINAEELEYRKKQFGGTWL